MDKMIIAGTILFVHDLENLKRFYIDHLSLDLSSEIPHEWVLLKAGAIELGLHKITEGYDFTASKHSETNSKLIFETSEDIFVVHKRMLEQQIIVMEVKTWDDYPYWVFDGNDPEGNVFQIRKRK